MTAHKRIRSFNTKDTYPEQKLDNDLCQAVIARGTMVFLRGQVAQESRQPGIAACRRRYRPDRKDHGQHQNC